MKKLFENWRKLLREGRWLFPKSKSDGPPPDPDPVGWTDNAAAADKVRKAKRAAAAARAAEKYGPKTDDAETVPTAPEKPEPPPFQKSGKMARRQRARDGKGVGSWSPKELEKKNEGEDTYEGRGADEGKSTKTIAIRVKRKEIK